MAARLVSGPALLTDHCRKHHPVGLLPLVLSRRGPRKEETPFMDGRFDALVSFLFEGIRIREGRVVATLSALEAKDSQAGFTLLYLTFSWHGHVTTHDIPWHPHGIPWRGIGFYGPPWGVP